MSRYGYTGEEKARIRAGMQCPECFGARVHDRYAQFGRGTAFECQECGTRWHAYDPQFQGGQP